jgi:hypothetical protein
MIGGCPGASIPSAAVMAGPQVRLGCGWNCDPSQTTAGDATAAGDGGGDDDEDGTAHPATTMATSAREIASLLMAPRTVRYPCRFRSVHDTRGPDKRLTMSLAPALRMPASPIRAVANGVPLAILRGIGRMATAENSAGPVKPAWSRSAGRAE